MKTPALIPLALLVGVLDCSNAALHGQTAPTIATQPVSQTNLAGSSVIFSVDVSGTGPFTYQWQFNGANLPIGVISTVAGNGTNKYAGDGNMATNASLSTPSGAALDGSGNLYIADFGNNRIRKVANNGIVSTFAGNGSAGFAGDGGAATSASLSGPNGVVSDSAGNVYIADAGNNCIRRVDTNGIITTVAGSVSAGFSGDGGAATSATLRGPAGVAFDAAGNLYIADHLNSRIRKVDTNGIISTVAGNGNLRYTGDGGLATNASLYWPNAVALDGLGNLYIADSFNSRIRQVNPNGIITTVAGTNGGSYAGDGGPAANASLNEPNGVALDLAGDLYIADFGNNRVREIGTNGIINTIAGVGGARFSGDGGPATSASLNEPYGVAMDAAGNLYIADQRDNRIRKVTLYAGYPTLTLTSVGAGNAGSYSVVISNASRGVTSAVATLTVLLPPSIIVPPLSQTVLNGSNATFGVNATGTQPLYYSWYNNTTNLVQSGASSTLALSSAVTNDDGNYTVVVSNSYGSVTSQVATLTVAFPPSITVQPASVAVLAGTGVTFAVTADGTGPFHYQWQFNGTNYSTNIITTVAGNGSGTYGGDGSAAVNAGLPSPIGVALDDAGNLYISEGAYPRIRKVDTNGIITTVAGTGTAGYSGDGGPAVSANLDYPAGLALDGAGNLYVADYGTNRIRKVDTNGNISTIAGNGSAGGVPVDGIPATASTLFAPQGVNFDGLGNLYFADTDEGRIRMVGVDGIISTVAGNGSITYSGDGGPATNAGFHFPSSVAVNAFGDLYIADQDNNRIRMVTTNGIISTVAGNGSPFYYMGDGGAATNTGLFIPSGVAFDAFGNLYIADTGNGAIRRVDASGVITSIAGNNKASGFSGDGGAATNAELRAPIGLCFDALGNLYFADLDNNRVREVQLAGYPTFAQSDVSATNAGNYAVVITSPYGSVTSAVATLTVAASAPQIVTGDGSFGFQANQFGFNVNAPAGLSIVVDGSTDLVNWTPLFTNTVANGPFYFSDPNWANFPGRFYRARLP